MKKIKKVKIEDLTLLEVLDDLECFALGSFECDDEQVSKRRANKSFENIKKEKEIIKSALEQKEKLEKVWEIVKEKKVNIQNFIKLKNWILGREFEDFTYHLYIKYFNGCGSLILTEEEFNFIKEILEEK